MTVYIIRHGESMANLHGDLPFQPGFSDITDDAVPLTQWGFGQAQEAGRKMRTELSGAEHASRKLVVVASPFLRTRQTAAGVLQGMGGECEPVFNEHLREQDFGKFNCITDRRLIAKLWPDDHAQFVKDRKSDKHNAKAPGGESRADVVERAKLLIEAHRADLEDPNTDVVFVGHGLVNRALEMCLRGLDSEWLRKEPNPGNCAIRQLEGDLKHGYSAQYIHTSKERSPSMPGDYKTKPHAQETEIAL